MTLQGILDYTPLSPDHVNPLFSHTHHDPDFYLQGLIIPTPSTEDNVREWVASRLADDTCQYHTITLDGYPVGVAGLGKIRTGVDAEVSYWVAEAHRGRGIAGASLSHLEDLAAEYALSYLYAFVDTDNKPSARVLIRHGFVPDPRAGFATFLDQDIYTKQLRRAEQTLNTPPHSSRLPCYEPTRAETSRPATPASR